MYAIRSYYALQLHSHVPSLYTLGDSVVSITYPPDTFYDAGVDFNTTLRLDEKLHVSTDMAIEWYLVQLTSPIKGPEDLIHVRVGSVTDTTSSNYLKENHLLFYPYQTAS